MTWWSRPPATKIREHIPSDAAPRMHALFKLMERYGGSMRTTLVTEEDIRWETTLGPFPEPFSVIFDGKEYRGRANDSVNFLWDMHWHPLYPMSVEHMARFKRLGK